MSKLTISHATKNNLEVVEALAWQIWPVYYQTIISLDQVEYMLREFGNPHFLGNQMDNGMQLYLAYEEKQPVGYMALMPVSKDKIKLDKLYLLPETRGKNYGRQILSFAESASKQEGAIFLTLNVNRFNPSLQFYEKCGFAVVEEVDIALGPFMLFDFIMEKRL